MTLIGRGQVHVFERARDSPARSCASARRCSTTAPPATIRPGCSQPRRPHGRGPAPEVQRWKRRSRPRGRSRRPLDACGLDLQRHPLSALLLWIARWYEASRTERREATTPTSTATRSDSSCRPTWAPRPSCRPAAITTTWASTSGRVAASARRPSHRRAPALDGAAAERRRGARARRGGGGGGRARRRRAPHPRPVADGRPLHVDLNTKGTPCRSRSSAPGTWPAASGGARWRGQRRDPARHRDDKAQALADDLSGNVSAGRSATRSPATSWCSPSGTRPRRRARPLRRPARRQGRRRHHQPRRRRHLPAARRRGRLGRPGDRAEGRPARKVVKAFNTTFAGTLAEGQVAGQPLDVLVASDDEDAKATFSRLVEDGGLRPSTPARSPRARARRRSATCTWRSRAGIGNAYASALKVVS